MLLFVELLDWRPIISFDDNLIIYLMINTLPYVFLKKIFPNKKQMIDRLMIASLCITAWLLL